MIRRIWRGQIGLAWAFWGVGVLGLYPLIALIIGTVSLGSIAASAKFVPLPIRLVVLSFFGSTPVQSLAIVLALSALIVPTVVIWRSAKRSSSKPKRFLAKSYVIAAAILAVAAPPIAVLGFAAIIINERLTPEHEEDTPELLAEAPAKFLELTGVEFPSRGRVAHAVYYRYPVLDYEFGSHIVVDASDLDVREWVRASRPFGVQLETVLPEDHGLEFNATGLDCTLPKLDTICNFVTTPTPTWHYKKRLDLDHVVSITVFEEAKVIWLYETSW